MTQYDIYLVGVGGQGVLTIGEIISEAAFRKNIPVSFYPTKGMAQRGGSVKSQLRIGRKGAGANIPEKGADLVISTELSETLKSVRFIRPGGEVLVYTFVWAPTDVLLGQSPYPKLEQVIDQIRRAGGEARLIEPASLPCYEDATVPENIYLLGAAMGCTRLGGVLDRVEVAELVRDRWKNGAERNLFAYEQGLKAFA